MTAHEPEATDVVTVNPSPWWRWPESRITGRAPWFVIMWRALWWLPMVASVMLSTLIVAIAFGPRSAKRMWDNL